MARKKVNGRNDDEFLEQLERGVLDVLNADEIVCPHCGEKVTAPLPTVERLKAIEAGTRLALIKHKIKPSGGDDEGNFFGRR